MGLEQLLPEYQAQYYALEPEVERSVRRASNARGMYYSGSSIDDEARAKADLLAKLAGESAAADTSSQEKAKDRQAAKDEAATSRRTSLMAAALGTGGGALATLGTLAYLNKTQPGSLVPLGDGKVGSYSNGQMRVVYDPAAGGAAGGPPPNMVPNAGGGLSPAPAGGAPGAAAPGAPGAATAPSNFKQPFGWQQLVAGAAGGVGGSELGKLAFGGGGLGGDIGAGVGGAGGFLAGMKYGGNPYAALFGAGLGAFGGRGLGGLI